MRTFVIIVIKNEDLVLEQVNDFLQSKDRRRRRRHNIYLIQGTQYRMVNSDKNDVTSTFVAIFFNVVYLAKIKFKTQHF